MAGSSKSAVVVALLGSAFLAILKFVTFAISGSGAMLSEAVHSVADTANQALLLIGIKRGARPASPAYPYGFGAERFFFNLLSAVGIFVLGCGVSLYHGIHSALHPPELSIGWMVYAVLGISFVIDATVLYKAVKIARADAPRGTGWVALFRGVQDPTLLAVLLEDTVACLGVIVALLGVVLSSATGSHIPDVVATLTIGLMMGAIALWLGYANRRLLVGAAMPARMQTDVLDYLNSQGTINEVHAVRSLVLGVGRFKFKAEVDWDGREFAERDLEWVEANAKLLDTSEGRRDFAREFGERITEAIAAEVDRIESEMSTRFPALTVVDFEDD